MLPQQEFEVLLVLRAPHRGNEIEQDYKSLSEYKVHHEDMCRKVMCQCST